MNTTVTLDERHFRAAAHEAKRLRKTLLQYLQWLIHADCMTFDKISALGRASVRRAERSQDDLGRVVNDARRAKRQPRVASRRN
jgi:hypothetical protein